MADVTYKLGEFGASNVLTSRPFKDAAGDPLPLSGATVTLELTSPYNVTASLATTGNDSGVATYTFADGDLDIPGLYRAYFKVVGPSSTYEEASASITIEVVAPGHSGPEIASVEGVKAALRIPASMQEHDSALKMCIEGAEADILCLADLDRFSVSTYSEKHDIEWDAQNDFRLHRRWARSVVALTNGGSLVAPADYYLSTRENYVRLISNASYFTKGRQQVEVTYTSGLIAAGATPADLRKLLVMMVALDFNSTPRAGLESESIGRRRYKLATGETATDREIARLRARYERGFV